jgi:hypothetical protein
MKYQPPYTITSKIIHLIAQISENIGRLTVLEEIQDSLKLEKLIVSVPFKAHLRLKGIL